MRNKKSPFGEDTKVYLDVKLIDYILKKTDKGNEQENFNGEQQRNNLNSFCDPLLRVVHFYIFENMQRIIGKNELTLDEIEAISEGDEFVLSTIFDTKIRISVREDDEDFVISGEVTDDKNNAISSFTIRINNSCITNEFLNISDNNRLCYYVDPRNCEYLLSKGSIDRLQESRVYAQSIATRLRGYSIYELKRGESSNKSGSKIKQIFKSIFGDDSIIRVKTSELPDDFDFELLKNLFSRLEAELELKNNQDKKLKKTEI